MFFNALNPYHWLRTILSLILIFVLLLIPGWRAVFAGKTLQETMQALSKNFFGVLATATEISISYYKSWFEKEGQEKFQNFKEKSLKSLEEKSKVK